MKLTLDIEYTLTQLLQQEDTDGDKRITIEDHGPKSFTILDETTQEKITLEGTYYLSNLLQELILAKEESRTTILKKFIFEAPVERLKRMIESYYWESLTRTIDKDGILKVLSDEKSGSAKQRIYVPFTDEKAYLYYKALETSIPNLEVLKLPEQITPEYARSINDKAGILPLQLEEKNGTMVGVPFVVPGGRFNEMYGWDSYFEAVGLLLGPKAELAKAMADNFQYEINHYGKILNANRTYYLTRTQPPFYTSLIRKVYENNKITSTIDWLKSHLTTALKEYFTVWMVTGKRLAQNGLNRYLAEGIGMPPETEAGHFNTILKPFAEKAGMSLEAYEKGYYQRTIKNGHLDAYFVHDRSVRESGHDTSYRLEDTCAHLTTVDLNTFLYKYETDFAYLVKTYFNDAFEYESENFSAAFWEEKAKQRKELMHRYLWNEKEACFYDYDIVNEQQVPFVSATSLLPLWAGIATKEQAAKLIEYTLPQLTFLGGVAGCTEGARGPINEDRPARQWDYPNGWAPHQMMLWKGLLQYGYTQKAHELIFRWLWMITKNAVDYNGTVPEKYDVVSATHKVFAEYGNVGTDFEYITKEGFGWMNASYIYGLSLLPTVLIEKLNTLEHPDSLF